METEEQLQFVLNEMIKIRSRIDEYRSILASGESSESREVVHNNLQHTIELYNEIVGAIAH